jgi:hypothetical protein
MILRHPGNASKQQASPVTGRQASATFRAIVKIGDVMKTICTDGAAMRLSHAILFNLTGVAS